MKALSVVEVAAQLAVSPYTVRSWLRQRRLAFYKLGRRIVVAEEDVEHFLAANRIPPREEAVR